MYLQSFQLAFSSLKPLYTFLIEIFFFLHQNTWQSSQFPEYSIYLEGRISNWHKKAEARRILRGPEGEGILLAPGFRCKTLSSVMFLWTTSYTWLEHSGWLSKSIAISLCFQANLSQRLGWWAKQQTWLSSAGTYYFEKIPKGPSCHKTLDRGKLGKVQL